MARGIVGVRRIWLASVTHTHRAAHMRMHLILAAPGQSVVFRALSSPCLVSSAKGMLFPTVAGSMSRTQVSTCEQCFVAAVQSG